MIKIACIGECMIELAHRGPADLQLAYGGDTLNTAVYLSRLTRGLEVSVDYVTALGDDAYSDAMLDFWRNEGLGVDLVARLPGRLPGLYTIRTDQRGERSFTYWRGQSAARDLLGNDLSRALADRLRGYDLLYLSGITLSILDEPQRRALHGLADAIRDAGGRIAFDGNYRPAGWSDPDVARTCFHDMLIRTDIALPTFDDEQALFGDRAPVDVAARLQGLGVRDVVVKQGADGCYLATPAFKGWIETPPVDPVIDSTAAGDSFNAGYLAACLLGAGPEASAKAGHRLAGRVLGHRGAIVPKTAMADLCPSVSGDG